MGAAYGVSQHIATSATGRPRWGRRNITEKTPDM